jgi:hypothetical protein
MSITGTPDNFCGEVDNFLNNTWRLCVTPPNSSTPTQFLAPGFIDVPTDAALSAARFFGSSNSDDIKWTGDQDSDD